MDKKELKSLIKPIIKECIREVLMEEGLRKVVTESVELPAKVSQQVVAAKPAQPQPENKKLQEHKKKLMDEIGKKGYAAAGFDPFSGTKPLTEGQASGAGGYSPLANIDPEDKGIDISGIIGNSAAVFKAINGGKK
jgi:hypothetical protein